MEQNNQTKQGRKPVAKGEKKVLIRTWVKEKYFAKALKECNAIELKYDKL